MQDIAFFYPEGHEAHSESGHPERPGRVEAIKATLEEAGLWEAYPHLEPLEVPLPVLDAVHHPDYRARLQQAAETGRRLDMDTYITPQSWQLALNAAGGACAVASAVWRQDAKRGFALSRPPGHHATPNRAMGFCLLNNIALASEYLVRIEGAKRLAIVDFDLHHGNGTQDIFYERGEVMFISTHQWPLYPGSGRLEETGRDDGLGANANLPLPPYSGDQAFESATQKIVLPLLERFQPEMLLVSAGFDAHWRDPLGQLLISSDVHADITANLTNWADQNSGGRIMLNLEGGYDLEASANSALAATMAMLGREWNDPLGPSRTAESDGWVRVIESARQIHEL